jgi:hypothetical protein
MRTLLTSILVTIAAMATISCMEQDMLDIPAGNVTRIDTLAMTGQKMSMSFEVEKNNRKPLAECTFKAGEPDDINTASSISWNEDMSRVTLEFIVSDQDMTADLKVWNVQNPRQYTISVRHHFLKTPEKVITLSGKEQVFEIPFSTSMKAEEERKLNGLYSITAEAGQDWIEVLSVSQNDRMITVKANRHNDFDFREGQVTINEKDGRFKPLKVTVEQNPVNEQVEGCVYFECMNFRRAVVQAGFDLDADNEISFEEAALIDSLDVSSQKITSMAGVEHMSGLRYLDFSDNEVQQDTYIDLSDPHHKLIDIKCDRDLKIDFTGCPAVIWIDTENLVMPVVYQTQNIVSNRFALGGNIFGESKNYIEVEDDYVSSDFSMNGETVVWQEHTRGKGIRIEWHMIGLADMEYRTDIWRRIADDTVESLFAFEPYRTFRDCFDIVFVKHVAKKRHEEIKSENYHHWQNIYSENGIIKQNIGHASNGNRPNTNYMGYTNFNNSPNIVAHEIGHNLAGLDDEYLDYDYPDTYESEVDTEFIFQQNVSVTDDPNRIPWKRFLLHPDYCSIVGIYEGARWRYGVYKPTNECIMKSNEKFCPVCRYLLFKEIIARSGIMGQMGQYRQSFSDQFNEEEEELLWQAFLEYDKINL